MNVNIFQQIVANELKSICIHNINILPVVIALLKMDFTWTEMDIRVDDPRGYLKST